MRAALDLRRVRNKGVRNKGVRIHCFKERVCDMMLACLDQSEPMKRACLPRSVIDVVRWNLKRGGPFGNETWVESTARRLDLESTLLPLGRPRVINHQTMTPDTFVSNGGRDCRKARAFCPPLRKGRQQGRGSLPALAY